MNLHHPDLGDPEANLLASFRLEQMRREQQEDQTRRRARCACGGEYKKGRLKTKQGHVRALRCSSCQETYLSARALIELLSEPFDEDL